MWSGLAFSLIHPLMILCMYMQNNDETTVQLYIYICLVIVGLFHLVNLTFICLLLCKQKQVSLEINTESFRKEKHNGSASSVEHK